MNHTYQPTELEAMKAAIQENFPDLEIQTLNILGEGMMSKAVLVNQKWVFRFPKTAQGASDLKKEISILPQLKNKLSLAIPDFHFLGNQKNGFPFVGYPILSGEILEEQGFAALSEKEREQLARAVANFISELHAFPNQKARELGKPEVNLFQKFTQIFRSVQQKVLPLVNTSMQAYICEKFESYLHSQANFQYTPALIHADLSLDHFIVDSSTQELTGIIDFGDIHIGDPDYEYIYILEDCGSAFTRQVMHANGLTEIRTRLEKVSFFVTADHLTDILEGIEKDESDLILEGVEALSQEMKLLKEHKLL